MKFLVYNQLPHTLAKLLDNLGHHAVHMLDVELGRAMTWPSGHTLSKRLQRTYWQAAEAADGN